LGIRREAEGSEEYLYMNQYIPISQFVKNRGFNPL
jgi:hypothetical protein